MKLGEIRDILMVQAVEQTDEDSEMLSKADRREASTRAGAPLPKPVSQAREDEFLAARASSLLVRLGGRYPEAAQWIHHEPNRHRLGLIGFALAAVAVAAGFFSSELGPEKRINILSFPLLGILAWSLFVYLREIFLFFQDRENLFQDGWLQWPIRLALPPEETMGKDGAEASPIHSAKALFDSRWQRLLIPVAGARVKAMLHLIALLLAGSAIAGMYVKGLASEYSAVWESTFFIESEQLRPFLQAVLGPAAALTGREFPSIEELDAIHMRSEGEAVAGENAAWWIHWYAITMAIYVLAPRALLAVLWRVRSSHLARTIPFRGVAPAYFEHLLATSTGSALRVRLLPYAHSPDEETREAMANRLERHFDRAVDAVTLPPIPFGEEEETAIPPDASVEETIPVFNFSSTPERETHLAVFRSLAAASEGPIRTILLDTAGFDQKNASFPDAEERRAARESAWKQLFVEESVELIFVSPTMASANTPAHRHGH